MKTSFRGGPQFEGVKKRSRKHGSAIVIGKKEEQELALDKYLLSAKLKLSAQEYKVFIALGLHSRTIKNVARKLRVGEHAVQNYWRSAKLKMTERKKEI